MNFETVYFIGIGGIGMSNLARYYASKGKKVGGYDRVESKLTQSLSKEGALIHYQDDVGSIPPSFLDKAKTLVVYTPAIPDSHKELSYFRKEGFTVMKRAQLLGLVTHGSRAVCVAGTHGKTTVSGMIAHQLRQSHVDCNAFLGGIMKNYDTNLFLSDKSDITVVEADEYDRSFHWLTPWIAVITSVDPDHLDIYGTADAYRESFEKFTSLIRKEGHLILKKGINLSPKVDSSVSVWTYGMLEGDFHAANVRIGNGEILFDLVTPKETITDISLGIPVKVNIENGVAASAAALLCGVTPDEARAALKTFTGAARRFDYHIKSDKIVFLDDYAHHPRELSAAVESIQQLYPDKKITAVFQPHLYSRTRDFADDFAESLSKLEDVILLDIYPAREEPIEGVSSRLIFDKIASPAKTLTTKQNLLKILDDRELEVLVTFGAGDIDRMLQDIEQLLRKKYLDESK